MTTVLMVGGIAILAAIYWNQNVTVQDIRVNALSFTEYEVVKNTAAVPVGIKPDSLNLDAIVNRVEKLDYVRSVKTYIEPNGTLRLTVTERDPIAILIDGSKRMYVDKEGVKLPVKEGVVMDLPLVYGYQTGLGDTLESNSFEQVRDFLMKARNDGFGWTTISEVAFDANDGVVALSHENGVKLIFGRNNFQTKLENWKAFYGQIVKTKGINTIQQVDLRFKNQVVTREI
jgi:cell division septal protein FtsQ